MSPIPSGQSPPALFAPETPNPQSVALPSELLTVAAFGPDINVSENISFTTSPIRVLDQTYEGTAGGGGSLRIDFRFGTINNTLQRQNVAGVIEDVPNLPQWKEDAVVLPVYSVRRISATGDGTPQFGTPANGVWNMITSPIVFGMNRPPAGGTRTLTYRIEMAQSSDLGTILASALLTLIYHRT